MPKKITAERLARKFHEVYKKENLCRDIGEYEELEHWERDLLITLARFCLPYFRNLSEEKIIKRLIKYFDGISADCGECLVVRQLRRLNPYLKFKV